MVSPTSLVRRLRRLGRFLPRVADYRPAQTRADLIAGVTVAVVALPLALGFGVTSGAGATAGLVTAIVAGFIAAVFGGSNYQVSGPTGAMTVVLLPIVARYGLGALAALSMLAGVLLIALALSGIGRYVNYIPYPVVTGFTAGIGVIIFLQQLPGSLGVAKPEAERVLDVAWQTIAGFADNADAAVPLLTAITVITMVLWVRVNRLRAVPASMAALIVGTLVSLLPTFDAVTRVGEIPFTMPMPTLSLGGIPANDLLRAAGAVAILAALESLLSAVVADGMAGGARHDPDRELFGQGLANIAAGMVGGMPATAALARTAVNVRSGARTRLAAAAHAVALAAFALVLGSLAARIPMAVLAGILMVVAVKMVEVHSIRQILRSTKSDATVLALTFGATVLFDLILAIEVGMISAGVLFVIRMSRLVDVSVIGTASAIPSLAPDGTATPEQKESVDLEPAATLDLSHRNVVIYAIEGPVFFGAADRLAEQLLAVSNEVQVMVVSLERVPVMDVTGATALHALHDRLSARRVVLLLAEVRPQPMEVLRRTGVLDLVTREGNHLFATVAAAADHATLHATGHDHVAPAMTDQSR